MPDLRNPQGEPTGAIYGVTNMLRKLRHDYKGARVVMVFDAPGGTFRDNLYPDYKATRATMPEDLRAQIDVLHAVIRALGVPLLAVPGFEADDVIGTLCAQARASGWAVVISTGDKDLAQLVDDQVTLINTMTDVQMGPKEVLARFGVGPHQIIDFLTLTGDKVDNIPGVPGAGPKTVARWLTQYGSLAGVMAHAAEVPGALGVALTAALPRLPLSRDLVTIRCDVPLPQNLADLVMAEPDQEALRALYRRCAFKAWLSDLGPSQEASVPVSLVATVVTEPSALMAFCGQAQSASWLAIDVAVAGNGVATALILGTASAAMYVSLEADLVATTCPWPLSVLAALFAAPVPPKIIHDSKRLQRVLHRYGLTLAGITVDPLLAAYVLDSGASEYSLPSLALKYLGRTLTLVEGQTSARLGTDTHPLAVAAAETVGVLRDLATDLGARLDAHPALRTIYQDLELPLVPVLADMEAAGVPIDVQMLKLQSAELAIRLRDLEKEAYALAGRPFNLNSPAQIQQILFEDLKLPVKKRTPKGQPSTAEEVLTELALEYPLPQMILDYRGIGKLKSTYTDKLPLMVDPVTHRIHTTYHQAVAATGRLSSSDPNLQNIPVRTAEGRRIRQAFVAGPGNALLSADYSQIELRLMAHLSQDRGLLQAFGEGLDVHRATAAEVFGVPLDAVSDDQRRAAKAINFGLMYGMSAFGLARQLRIDQGSAQNYCDRYFARYPAVQGYMQAQREKARTQGYVETLLGRRLYVPDIKASNAARRQYAERTAINAPLQGTAADLIKRAMLTVAAFLQKDGYQSQMIMQVHDELVFEGPVAELPSLENKVRTAMVGAAHLSVPLIVDCGIGQNWDEAH